MRRTITIATAALLALLSANLPAKTIFQCTDHNGKTVLSDGSGCREAKQKVPSRASHTGTPTSTSTPSKPVGSSVKIKQCDPTGCWSGNVRYNKINADNYVSSTGKSCKRVGNTMHCN